VPQLAPPACTVGAAPHTLRVRWLPPWTGAPLSAVEVWVAEADVRVERPVHSWDADSATREVVINLGQVADVALYTVRVRSRRGNTWGPYSEPAICSQYLPVH